MRFKYSFLILFVVFFIGCSSPESQNSQPEGVVSSPAENPEPSLNLTPLVENPQNDGSATSVPTKLPDFSSPEEVVISALTAWLAGDRDLFIKHFYLGTVSGEPALDLLSHCDIQNLDEINLQTEPAPDVGPNISRVSVNIGGRPMGSILVNDVTRFRITAAEINCSN
ncbi:MAG: hypothetical protein KC441_19285 [Anaerolineales bacterium]|nr:hypothetical protein [Anaerolineales bacterium]